MSSAIDWMAANWETLAKGAVATATLATMRQWGGFLRGLCQGCWTGIVSWMSAPYERDLLKRQLHFTQEQEKWAEADLAEALATIADLKRRLAAGEFAASSAPGHSAPAASTPTTTPKPRPPRRTQRPSARPQGR